VFTNKIAMEHGDSNMTHNKTCLGLSRITTLIFAVAAGLSVANIYFAQPLLDSMAQDLGIKSAAIGLVVTVTQVGYGLGLIFIVPLGDLFDRRRLIVGQFILSVIALVFVATARTEVVLFVSLATMGFLAVVVQVLVAFAATLATPSERGKAVGMVTSGIVIGILAARFIAGIRSRRMARGLSDLSYSYGCNGRPAHPRPATTSYAGKHRKLHRQPALNPGSVSA